MEKILANFKSATSLIESAKNAPKPSTVQSPIKEDDNENTAGESSENLFEGKEPEEESGSEEVKE